ncbi:hypothetical protein BBF96_12570 [Anoxybacter fermentans]|uniref:4Fe-4S ferredoxin-type domain-containing protein n=1 Tax=Anoxybacter fermentans TaxID=1323375 RepID=A0A3S9T0X8_9FIRM|nr:4Fe-4S dicluster domain-containing protein [Anoxybacter fermentans]AZR74157.1 hypothetical protein BBF96_12570 [Anoxybacter fermentans]
MLNIVTELTKLKRRIYISLARFTLKDQLVEKVESLPELLANADTPRYRCCEYKEQAILKEMIKLAMGFDPEQYKNMSLIEMAKQIDQLESDKRIIHVLSVACDRCPIDKYMITDACRNCVAHSCVSACPRNAIVIIQNRAYIDQGKCIECGRCKVACPFGAILENIRPCERACAVDAIKADYSRQASIDYEKCIGCGNCVRSCPFGAIEDSTQIIQVIKMLKDPETKVNAIIAPSFIGQFGAKVSPGKLKAALVEIGFSEVYEVALGADMVALNEAHELVERLEKGQPFMTSSCCPSFLSLIQKYFPEIADKASTTVSPMIALARLLKKTDPESKMVFIGPCITKKIEAQKEKDIDAVLTFEELGCILVSMGINLAEYELEEEIKDASSHGRNFAYAGGVANVIREILKEEGKENLIKFAHVDGIVNCKEALQKLVEGKLDCNFLEGMGCEGGCVGGPGSMMNSKITTRLVQKFADKARWKLALENKAAEEKRKSLAHAMER